MERGLVREYFPGGPAILTILSVVSIIGLVATVYKMNKARAEAQPTAAGTVQPFFRR